MDLIKKEQLIDEDENTSKQLGGSIEPQVFSCDRYSDSEDDQFINQSIVEFKSDTRSFKTLTIESQNSDEMEKIRQKRNTNVEYPKEQGLRIKNSNLDTFDPNNVMMNTEFEFNGVLNVNKHVSAVSELTNNNMYNIHNTRSSHATD